MIDLSSLNRYITLTKFKTGTGSLVLGLIRKRDFMFFIDFKDAHIPVAIHPDF